MTKKGKKILKKEASTCQKFYIFYRRKSIYPTITICFADFVTLFNKQNKLKMDKNNKTIPKCKHFTLTINNPEVEASSMYDPALMSYLILGTEIGKSGTLHFQGFVSYKCRKTLRYVSKHFPRAHIEIARNLVASIEYCKKEKNFVVFGAPPESNIVSIKRKWADDRANAMSGNFKDIRDNVYMMYYSNIKRIRMDNPDKPADLKSLDNYWIYGETGNGKSRFARKKWVKIYDKGPNKWWIGYKNEPTVLLDDLGPDQCKFLGYYMKRWADLYSFPAEEKGSGRQIRPRRIVVTSQYTIEQCFPFNLKDQKALLRRFQVIHLKHWRHRKPKNVFQSNEDQLEVLAKCAAPMTLEERLDRLPQVVSNLLPIAKRPIGPVYVENNNKMYRTSSTLMGKPILVPAPYIMTREERTKHDHDNCYKDYHN